MRRDRVGVQQPSALVIDSEELDRRALAASFWPTARRRARAIALREGLPRLADEFESIAGVAVADAAARFEPERGVPFDAYAQLRLVGAIRDFQRNADPLTRRQRRLVRCSAAADELGPQATDVARCAQLGISADELDRGRELSIAHGPLSLDADDGAAIQLADQTSPEPPAPLLDELERDAVRGALAALPERSRSIVIEVYLKGRTLADVGRELGVTESRICQVCRAATRSMRQHLEQQDADPARAA